jgi:hypothetical protein
MKTMGTMSMLGGAQKVVVSKLRDGSTTVEWDDVALILNIGDVLTIRRVSIIDDGVHVELTEHE